MNISGACLFVLHSITHQMSQQSITFLSATKKLWAIQQQQQQQQTKQQQTGLLLNHIAVKYWIA